MEDGLDFASTGVGVEQVDAGGGHVPQVVRPAIVGNFGGMRQIVGYDAVSLGGWDIADGHRVWTLIPPQKGDFNTPTPIAVDGRLLVSSENNGTRLYDFDDCGVICQEPVAEHCDLAPDASTPPPA